MNPALNVPSRAARARAKEGKMLKHAADRRSIGFVALTLALHAYALAGRVNDWTLLSMLFYTTASAVLCCICFVINHNHIHSPFFLSSRWNQAFSVLISMAEGLASKFAVVPHNMNHHVYGGKQGDWCHEENAGKGWGFVRMLRYVALSWRNVIRERFGERGPKVPARFIRQEIMEHAAVMAFTAAAVAVNWKAFVLVVLPAWAVGVGFITLTNLAQHEDTDIESADPYEHSRNFVGRFSNWLMFNAGYHTAHHLKPALHWSELERFHNEIAPKIPQRLNEPSILWYLARNYVFGWK